MAIVEKLIFELGSHFPFHELMIHQITSPNQLQMT